MAGVPMSSSAPIVQPQQTQGSSVVGSFGGGVFSKFFTEEGRVREVLQQLHGRLVSAHQLSLPMAAQQPPVSTGITSTSSSQQDTAGRLSSVDITGQIAQTEEMRKRLLETLSRLQEAVQDVSLAGLQERFSNMAASLGLKFDVQHSKQSELCSFFLACDAFYVEVCCQDNGLVQTVKVAQANKQVDSELLTRLAVEGKFQHLQQHLFSLMDFYSQGGGPSCEHCNMYYVITSLESMLLSITKMMSPENILSEVILANPLGHVIPRSGGLPMKLVFFVHPYDILKSPSRYSSHLSAKDYQQEVDSPHLGVSACLSLQSSDKVYPLSIDPHLFDVSKATFFPLAPQKTKSISARYVLHLSQDLPVSGAIRRELHNVISSDPYQAVVGPHINQVIAREAARSRGEAVDTTSKSRVVCLPRQRHHYYVPPELLLRDDATDPSFPPSDCGCVVNKVPFLHPVHIFNLVTLIRKQLVYNALVSSVLGRRARRFPQVEETEEEFIFRLSTQPAANKITVTVDMMSQDKFLAIDFVTSDQTPSCPVVLVRTSLEGPPVENANLSKIVKQCMSIPVTMYAIAKQPALLGESAVPIFQSYVDSINEFNRQLAGSEGGGGDEEEEDVGITSKRKKEGADLMDIMEVGSFTPGLKRKRTD